MASNPLFGQAAGQNVTLASLLAGQNQMQDPAVAAFAPRLQLSQALLQQGLDGSPVASSKYGGLSRMVSALAGLYGMNQATEGLNDIATKNRNDALALSSKWDAQSPFAAAAPAAAPAVAAPQAPAAPVAAAPGVAAGGQGPGEVPAELLPHFQEASAATGIPMSVLVAQSRQESSFNPNAIGRNGEVGLTQIKPSTAALPGFGVEGVDPSTLKDPRTNIMFGAKYLAARAKNAGVTDWNDPQQVATALKAYNGGGDPNYVQNVTRYLPSADKGVQVAGPGAPTQQGGGVPPSVTPGAVASAPQGAGVPGGGVPPAVTPGAVPQAAGVPQTGINSPNIKRGMEMIRDAHQQQLLYPHNLQIQTLAQQRIEEAKLLMGLDTVVQNPDGTQTRVNTGENIGAAKPLPHYVQDQEGAHDTTGQNAPSYKPAPRVFEKPGGGVGAVGPGGVVTNLADNPSGITGNSPESNAMRIMAEIGPKISAGTATPQEMSNYAVAAHTYQNFKTTTDPASKSLVSIPERQVPPGMPQPGGAAAPAAPQPLTGSPRGPDTADAIVKDQAALDAKHISDEQDAVLKGHNILNTTSTIRALQPDVKAGIGADARLQVSQLASAMGMSPESAQKYFGTNPVHGEILQKKLFELVTGADRALGAREPGMVLQMIQKNYPSLSSRDMTIDTMTRLLDMDQTYKEDEIAARRGHLDTAVEGIRNGKPYSGLSGYTQPDIRVYQSAALASSGMPFKTWTHGLSPDQQTEALRLSARLYPEAGVLDGNGVKHTFQRPPNG